MGEAAAAYEAAGDALAAVRATLAADPERGSAAAAALAMRLGSPAAAAAVVQHCQAAGDHAVWSSLMLAVFAVQCAQCLTCEYWGLQSLMPFHVQCPHDIKLADAMQHCLVSFFWVCGRYKALKGRQGYIKQSACSSCC